MQRLTRRPSPAMVVACLSLFVSLGGVSYAVATIDSGDIVNGSIRNRDFKDGTLRGQEAKPDGFGPNAIKEQALDASKLGQVRSAAVADGLGRHAVISNTGATVRGRGVASSSQTGTGQYLSSTATYASARTPRRWATSRLPGPGRGRSPSRRRPRA